MVGRTAYVFAGFSSEQGWLNDLHALDLDSQAWTRLNVDGLPSPRDKLCAAVVNQSDILVGPCCCCFVKLRLVFFRYLYINGTWQFFGGFGTAMESASAASDAQKKPPVGNDDEDENDDEHDDDDEDDDDEEDEDAVKFTWFNDVHIFDTGGCALL